MTTVIPADFLRVKYRREAHEPSFNEDTKVEGKAWSMARKVKPPALDISEEMANLRFKVRICYKCHVCSCHLYPQIPSQQRQPLTTTVLLSE